MLSKRTDYSSFFCPFWCLLNCISPFPALTPLKELPGCWGR
jgi:hypothetical protein